MVTPAYRLKQLGGMEEAELVASRIAASKMGFFTTLPDGAGFDEDETEEDGALISEAEPGTFEKLPEGVDFKPWDPSHPNAAFESFSKSMLRGIASGLNVSYVGLANDLEGVSYSSIRSGELSDRDAWRLLQSWFVENLNDLVFPQWLSMALMSNALDLPYRKKDKFSKPHWQPRGWNWVDPQKEIKANISAVRNGFKSLSDVISEQGMDIDEVFDRLSREKALAEKYGLELPVLFGEKDNAKIN
jgi:lambda family phage portal protein